MTKTYYGFGQKEKPALLGFRLEQGLAYPKESLGTYHRHPCDSLIALSPSVKKPQTESIIITVQ
jgi:hypothetical protein